MGGTVVNRDSLSEFLFRLISTEKIRVKETNGVIELMPIKESVDSKVSCHLRGLCADGKISSYSFMENKQAEKELEI